MYKKEIKYDRITRDYACYLNGELVGYTANYSEGEMMLDQLVSQMIQAESVAVYQIDQRAA